MNSHPAAGSKWTERSSASGAKFMEDDSMFRLLFERSADAITLLDPLTGKFVDVNAASVRIAGAPDKAALLRGGPAEISPEHQPDGTLSLDKVKEVFELAFERGSHSFEWVINRFDGSELPVEIVLTPIRGGDRPLLLSVARDISERKRAETELRENQQLLVSIVENITEAVYRTGPDHDLIFVNRAYLRLCGYDSLEELRCVPREQLYANPADRARLKEALANEGRFHNETVEYVRRDGSRWWGLTNSITIRHPKSGKILYHVGSIADITERKSAADDLEKLNASLERRIEERTAELTASEARLRTLVEHAPEAIVVFDGDTGRFLSGNAHACSLYGRNAKELVELSPGEVSPEFQPDGRLSSAVAREKMNEALNGGAPVFEWIHRHSSGQLIPTEVRLVRLPGEGKRLLRASIIDNSERKRTEQALRESEQKFRALFETSSQGVMLHDEKQYLEVNPAAVRILGRSSQEELIGKHPSETSPPLQSNGERSVVLARKHIADCLANGSTRFEWLARHVGGWDIPLEVVLTRIEWGGRQIIQAFISDISDRKRAEAELLKTLAREKELGELKSNFVSMVSHEFRTPLGIIQSSAEILSDYFERLEAGERAEQLESIVKNTRRMAAMMEEILVLSRLDAGKVICQPASFDLPAFCRRIVRELLAATNRRCPIELSLSPDLEPATGDERLIEHIFTNLLNNAVKYSEPGSTVGLSVERDGVNAVCTIRDRGIGIPLSDRQSLFKTFQRGTNVGDRQGTGLGLVLVKRCLDLHGGTIDVESEVDRGSTFTVNLSLFAQDDHPGKKGNPDTNR